MILGLIHLLQHHLQIHSRLQKILHASSILKPIKSSPEKLAVPVTRSTLSVLIKPHPSQSIPLGFAIINPASLPNTSIVPFKSLTVLPVTCNRIRDASLPAVILGLAVTVVPPNWAVPPTVLLFS